MPEHKDDTIPTPNSNHTLPETHEIDEDGMEDFEPPLPYVNDLQVRPHTDLLPNEVTSQGNNAAVNQEGGNAAHKVINSALPTPEDEEFLQSLFLSDEELAAREARRKEASITKKGEPRKYRPGRLPLYFRHEVERIRADPRSDVLMAEAENVSPVTIARVRQHGIYKNIPYIARDEINREAQAMGLQSHMSHLHPTYIAKSLGRPVKSGRASPSDDERKAIAYDKREVGEVAKAFGVSRSFVYKMRAQFGVRWVRVDPLSPFQREKFEMLKHTKDVDGISRALNLPALVVQALLDGEFAQVTTGGNDGGDA